MQLEQTITVIVMVITSASMTKEADSDLMESSSEGKKV